VKFIDEYRDEAAAKLIATKIADIITKPHTIMEICGGQTHTIVKYGLEQLLPKEITIVHGPGCPVCVTPVESIDKAVEIASYDNVIFTSFGDMLRVPGSKKDLLSLRADGKDIRIVYSPLDAVNLAKENPEKKIVFFAVGFETTAPANAMSVKLAKKLNLKNYSILTSQVLVPPAMELLLSSPSTKINGFLAAGHVCTVMGYHEYIPIAEKYKVPIVVTGFEPIDILQGIYLAVKQLEENRFDVENQYARAVVKDGNIPAQQLLKDVFKVVDKQWRGIGKIALSGLALNDFYADYDAENIFDLQVSSFEENSLCIAGDILQGNKKPFDCAAFGKTCNPEHPVGAPMVSSEGACAAYFRYAKV